MMLESTKTVKEYALEMLGATRIFEKLGIDYCCGGGKSLAEACDKAGVAVDEVLSSLKGVGCSNETSASEGWQTASLAALIAHIVEKHHTFTRQELARLEALLAKVCGVHGQNHPELFRIQKQFQELSRDLEPHMLKEERVLFPYIMQMEEAAKNNRTLTAPPFGTVRNPVRVMMAEHDAAGETLREMRALSSDYTVPEDACISYQTLYGALAALEADLHQHIHLENNILFPRAAETEASTLLN
ncbi:MAG TPA: iron-sulfur cluster repair di-iron protein [Pyrinomonadaceae bacterium]|nr:iron-sulfur cluster repair di-iron protein [Pyrinomonadaceae bacterium]